MTRNVVNQSIIKSLCQFKSLISYETNQCLHMLYPYPIKLKGQMVSLPYQTDPEE